MNDQIREKEKSLAELMVRILKEPLKPLDKSLQGLEDQLSDIKSELELVSGTVTDGLKKSDDAARRRSNEALEALRSLSDEQGEGVAALQASIAEHAQAGAQALDARQTESLTALAQNERRILDAVASLSEEQRSTTRTLAALPAQLREPLKPLGESLQSLEGKLSNIKSELELVSGTLAEDLKKSDDAAKQRSNEALEALRSLSDEQGEGVATLQASIAEHAQAGAQALDARQTENLTALAQSERRVLDTVASLSEAQRSVAQTIAALPAQFSDMKGAVEHAQTVMAENLQAGQALRDSLASAQAEVIGALNQHAETLNARLDQSQAKLQQLTITMGVLFVSMLAYIGYELLRQLTSL